MNRYTLEANNSTDTFKTCAMKYLSDNQGFILSNLNADNLDKLIRLKIPDWFEDFISMAYHRKSFGGISTLVFPNVNPIAEKAIERLESFTILEDIEKSNFFFFPSQVIGEWGLRAGEFMSSIKLKGLPPFIMYRETVSCANHQDEWQELLVPRSEVGGFIQYVQGLENEVKRITINAWGQRVYNVKPLEWNDLIVDESVHFMVRDDLNSFLQRKSWFMQKGIPYRRGYLLYGPPGNGKTTTIRAMMTQAKLPAFTIKKMYDEDSIDYFEDMFSEAAKVGSSFIILEDIDRNFASKNSGKKDMHHDNFNPSIPFSVFLNCLDGINEADGVIVVATANNPEVLDPAILQRPGRFDRVIGFPNPSEDLRRKYFTNLIPSLDSADLVDTINKTKDMSFAQLREVYILAVQLADSQNGREVEGKDLSDAAVKLTDYIKKAGISDRAGFR